MSVFAPACTISAYPTLAPRYALHQVSGGGGYGLEKQKNIRCDSSWKVNRTR